MPWMWCLSWISVLSGTNATTPGFRHWSLTTLSHTCSRRVSAKLVLTGTLWPCSTPDGTLRLTTATQTTLKHNVSSTLMTASEFDIFASALTNFEESTPLITADHGCEAMMDALRKLPFRKCPSIAENILLFTDKDGEQACFPHEEDYIKMRETLSGHGFTLNVIIDRRLGNISGNPVLGIDAHHTAFVLTKPNRKNWMAKVGFPIVINRTKRRSYVRLAMELGGGVWDINAVTHSEKARLAFADVLATGVHKQMQTCRLCTCQSDASYHCSLQYVRRTLNKEGKNPCCQTTLLVENVNFWNTDSIENILSDHKALVSAA